MTYIPDARMRFKPILTVKSRKNEINGYWEGYLNDKDKDSLFEYDYCTEQATRIFFSNIGDYEFLEELFSEDEIEDISNNPLIFDLETDLPEDAPKYIKFLRGLHEEIECQLDMTRDEIVVSMIDNMDEEEYEAIRKERDKDLSEEIRNLEYNQI